MTSLLQNSSKPVVAAEWPLVPPALGNLDAYISVVNRMPMITPEEEVDYATRLQKEGDLEAAGRLVMSHLRVVVSISRQYLGYGLPQADLIQEGNIGLMKAVRHFDPTQGVRLVTYAMHWIKAEIHEYILRNWRMVKVATTKAQRKLFFNLRSLKNSFKADIAQQGEEAHYTSLTDSEIDQVAQKLNVKREEVVEMEVRMNGGDVVIDGPSNNDDSSSHATFAPIAYLSDDLMEPTAILEQRERDSMATDGIQKALEGLDERSRRIVKERWLNVNDDGSGGMTLGQLAKEYGVSIERIRQIEAAAMKKMRKSMTVA